MKKKLLCLFMTAAMMVSFAACGNNSGSNEGSSPTAAQTEKAGNTATDTPSEEANSDSNTDTENSTANEKVTVTYANWNLGTEEENNVERQMISQFNSNNELIDVVIADNVDYSDYANSLNTLAASGTLPDIIMLQNIPQPYANKWLADITSIANAESEWANISKSLVESSSVNGKIVAVPFAMHMFGALVVVDAFEAANVDVPKYGISLSDFEAALRAVNQPQNAIVAIKHEGDMINWLPSVFDKSLGYFTFDGDKFNLDSDAVLSSFRKISEYRSEGLTFPSLTDEQKANFAGPGDWDAWSNGQVAVNFDGTWAITGAMKDFNVNIEFMGLPENLSVIVPDYFAITPTCKNQSEAFEFMKWMSFGKDGFLKRIEIAEASGIAYFSMPISSDAEVLAKFTEFLTVPGIQEVYADIDNAIIEGPKVFPGYSDVRWNAQTGLSIQDANGDTIENANMGQIFEASSMRGLNYADYAARINDLANEKYNEAKEAMQ